MNSVNLPMLIELACTHVKAAYATAAYCFHSKICTSSIDGSNSAQNSFVQDDSSAKNSGTAFHRS